MEYKFATSNKPVAMEASRTIAPLTPPSPGKAFLPKHPTTAFITKLWDIVNDPTTDGLVRWSTGDVVDVLDVAAFSHQILPQYFSHNNWPSFVRQLNMYGFRRVKESVLLSTSSSRLGSNDTYQFMHDFFRRNQRHLLHRIRRKPQNSTIHSVTSSNVHPQHSHHKRSIVTQEAMEKRLDMLHEQLRAVESKYTAMLNETQELYSLHSQQVQLLASVLNTLADTHENHPVILNLYEKLKRVVDRAEDTLVSSARQIQLPPLAEVVQNTPMTPTTPLLPPLQDHEIKQA